MKNILKLIGTYTHRLDFEHLYIFDGYVYFGDSHSVTRIKSNLLPELSELVEKLDPSVYHALNRFDLKNLKGEFVRLDSNEVVFESKDSEIKIPLLKDLSDIQVNTLKEYKKKFVNIEQQFVEDGWNVVGVRLNPELLFYVSKLFQDIEGLKYPDVKVKKINKFTSFVTGRNKDVQQIVTILSNSIK